MKRKFIFHLFIFSMILTSPTCHIDNPNTLSQKETNEQIIKIALITGHFSTLENGSCPPAAQIHVLDPGTYTITLQQGDVYWFDPTVRKQTYGAWYSFQVNEIAGQDVKLFNVGCNNNNTWLTSSAMQDSGIVGNPTENLYLQLFREDRKNVPYIKMSQGSGSFSFTVPGSQAVPQL